MPKIPDYVCELADGRRVRFSLKKRPDNPYWKVTFRDPKHERRELITSARAKHAALEEAITIIQDEYKPVDEDKPAVSWKDTIDLMRRSMKASNLRPGSIQQYELVVNILHKTFPDTFGPADITPALAEQFKMVRMEAKLSPRTVEGNIGNLSIVYAHWLRDTLKIVDADPFADVDSPRHDKQAPRIILADEQRVFLEWLQKRWNWRLPILFLEVKAAIGCRIGELACLQTANIKDGRICFVSETTKGRKTRACRLPSDVLAELQAIAGPRFAWESFSDGLRESHKKRGAPHHAKLVQEFAPGRLIRWLQEETKTYFDETKAVPFKLHNFRATAMSKARMAGIAESDAAIAFGCNPDTMRHHYLTLDEAAIADKVFEDLLRISGLGVGPKNEKSTHIEST